jgi:hypothetical protein
LKQCRKVGYHQKTDLACLSILFANETGCSTNRLNDGKVGCEILIMPKTIWGCFSTYRGSHQPVFFCSYLPFQN